MQSPNRELQPPVFAQDQAMVFSLGQPLQKQKHQQQNQETFTLSQQQYQQQSIPSAQYVSPARAKPNQGILTENTSPSYLVNTAASSNYQGLATPQRTNDQSNVAHFCDQEWKNDQFGDTQQFMEENQQIEDPYQEIANLRETLALKEAELQQEKRINRAVSTEFLTKIPNAEKAIQELLEENEKLQSLLNNIHGEEQQNSMIISENTRLRDQNKRLTAMNSDLVQQVVQNHKLLFESQNKEKVNELDKTQQQMRQEQNSQQLEELQLSLMRAESYADLLKADLLSLEQKYQTVVLDNKRLQLDMKLADKRNQQMKSNKIESYKEFQSSRAFLQENNQEIKCQQANIVTQNKRNNIKIQEQNVAKYNECEDDNYLTQQISIQHSGADITIRIDPVSHTP